jgi:lantibiotic biosynthesis protein
MTRGRWRPLLDGEDAGRARAVLEALAAGLAAVVPRDDGEAADFGTLMRGEPAVALFFAYLARLTGEPRFGDLAGEALDRGIDAAMARGTNPYLFSGLAGVAWTIEHLTPAAPGEEDANDDMDAAILEHLASPPAELPLGLSAGLVGLGLYAIERMPRPGAIAILERLVALLSDRAVRDEDGIRWGDGATLGVAEGVAGQLGLLAAAVTHDVSPAVARPLLDGAVTWLAGRPIDALSSGWAHGTTGVAAALLAAGIALGDERLIDAALQRARRPIRLPLAAPGGAAVGLGDGLAGLGHVDNRFFQATGETLFADRARARLDEAVARFRPQLDRGLLDGSAGVGLALIAALDDHEPGWDRLLLMSLRQPA